MISAEQKRYEEAFAQLSHRLDAPEVRAAAEQRVRQSLLPGVLEHRRTLRHSRTIAHTRAVG